MKVMAKTAEEANHFHCYKGKKKLGYLVNCREISNAAQTFFFLLNPAKFFFFFLIIVFFKLSSALNLHGVVQFVFHH